MRFDLHPFKTLEQALEWGRAEIDAAAGAARARYLTITSGQDATYGAKYADALAFWRAGYPENVDMYPWVAAEARATNVTPKEAADGIRAVGDPWNMEIGPSIEAWRIGGKTTIEKKDTIAGIVSHVYHVKASLAAV